VEGKTFIFRRPTDWEAHEMQGVDVRQMDVLEKFVEGWENVAELDLVPGGDATSAEFDRALFADWVQDNPKYWLPLCSAIVAEYESHAAKLVESAKK
jgi:hypothetical protein